MQSDDSQVPQVPQEVNPVPPPQPNFQAFQPGGYPPQMPVYPPQPPAYYPPYPQTRPEHPRVAAIGIMNLVFSFPYLALTILSLIGAANPLAGMGMSSSYSYSMSFSTILNLIGMGLGGLLLLIGGANLLAHKKTGKTMTQLAAGILVAVMAFNTVISLTNVRGSYFGTAFLSLLLVVGLLLVYPLTAALAINRTPEELGLY